MDSESFSVVALQENLARAVTAIWPAVPRSTRHLPPACGYIVLRTDRGRLTLTATNIDMTLTATCGAMIKGEGAMAVPARLFGDYMKALPPVTVALRESPDVSYPHPQRVTRGNIPALAVEGARNLSTIATFPVDDYPRIHEWPKSGEAIATPHCVAGIIGRWNNNRWGLTEAPEVVRAGNRIHFRFNSRPRTGRSYAEVDLTGSVADMP